MLKFNKVLNKTKFYKITSHKEIFNGYKLKNGLNIFNEPFQKT